MGVWREGCVVCEVCVTERVCMMCCGVALGWDCNVVYWIVFCGGVMVWCDNV